MSAILDHVIGVHLVAYLDPGSGSLLVQALVGGVAALGVSLRLFRSRIRDAFRRRPSDETDE